MIEFISTLVVLVIGFIIGAYTFHIPSRWKPWEDVSIIYEDEDYTFSLLQVRLNDKGDRQFRKIKIVKYANLNVEEQNKIFKVLGTFNDKLNLDKK